MTVEQLTSRALALPHEERAQLAEELLKSLDASDNDLPVEIDQELVDEILRRREEIRRDSSRLIPWEVARERLSDSLRKAER